MIVNILSSPMQQYLGACRLFPKQLSDSSHQSGNHTDSLSNRISVDAKLQTMNITRRQPKYCASICIVGYVPCGSFRFTTSWEANVVYRKENITIVLSPSKS